MDENGLVREVDFVQIWKAPVDFLMKWDDYGNSKEYDIKFYDKKDLSQLNKELFSPELSMIRKGWIARYKIEDNGIPRSVEIVDEMDNLYYFYRSNMEREIGVSIFYTQILLVIGSHS